jgi:hypothetical protein
MLDSLPPAIMAMNQIPGQNIYISGFVSCLHFLLVPTSIYFVATY